MSLPSCLCGWTLNVRDVQELTKHRRRPVRQLRLKRAGLSIHDVDSKASIWGSSNSTNQVGKLRRDSSEGTGVLQYTVFQHGRFQFPTLSAVLSSLVTRTAATEYYPLPVLIEVHTGALSITDRNLAAHRYRRSVVSLPTLNQFGVRLNTALSLLKSRLAGTTTPVVLNCTAVAQ